MDETIILAIKWIVGGIIVIAIINAISIRGVRVDGNRPHLPPG